MLGTNDLKTRFSLTPFDIGASVENLVKVLLKSDAGIDYQPPKVLLVTPVQFIVWDRMIWIICSLMWKRSQALAHYYEEVANRYQIEYLNPGSAIETNELDGIHYSAKGHAAMAELMEKR